jgi:hypothetical protein
MLKELRYPVLAAFAVAATAGAAAQRAASPADATAHVVSAARAVLESLDDAGRAKVQFAFDDEVQRKRWSNLPSPMVERRGVRMGDLNDAQRAAVMALLQAALSVEGYRKVNEIMRGDEVLRTGGGAAGPRGGPPPGANPPPGAAPAGGSPARGGRGGRGPGGGGPPAFGLDNYWLAFLGTPSATSPWMIQFGGHHLAINRRLAEAARA